MTQTIREFKINNGKTECWIYADRGVGGKEFDRVVEITKFTMKDYVNAFCIEGQEDVAALPYELILAFAKNGKGYVYEISDGNETFYAATFKEARDMCFNFYV